MLFAMRLPRTEVTLVYYRRKRCRLSVKRRRCSQNSAGCANKGARLWPASVPVRRGLECVERAKRKLYMRTAKKRPRSFERERYFFAVILLVFLRLHLQRLSVHLLQQQELQPLHQLRQREQQLFPHPQQIAVLIAAFLLR